VAGSPEALIGRVWVKVAPQERHRNSYVGMGPIAPADYRTVSVRVRLPLLRWLDPWHPMSGSYRACQLRLGVHAFCRHRVLRDRPA